MLATHRNRVRKRSGEAAVGRVGLLAAADALDRPRKLLCRREAVYRRGRFGEEQLLGEGGLHSGLLDSRAAGSWL